MSLLNLAIRKSETALEHIVALLSLAAVAMLGLVWLSIAATGWLGLLVPAPVAAAITGAVSMLIAAVAFFYNRSRQSHAKPAQDPGESRSTSTDDLISRVMMISQNMIADAPLASMLLASSASFAVVSMPEAFVPYFKKILDDVERAPKSAGNE